MDGWSYHTYSTRKTVVETYVVLATVGSSLDFRRRGGGGDLCASKRTLVDVVNVGNFQ